MKKHVISFTALFLALTTMPGLASIKSNVTGSDICENINCVQNKMGSLVEFTKPIKYISSLNYQDVPEKIRTDWEGKCIRLVTNTKGAKQNVTVDDVVSHKENNGIHELLCVLQCVYTKLDNKTCRDKKSAIKTQLTNSIKPNEQIYIDEDLRKDEDILSDLENWQKKCTELLKKTTGDIESIEVKVASDNSSATCVIKCKDDATYDAVQNKCIKNNTTYKVQIVDEVTGKEIPNITITGLPKNCTRDGNTIICIKTTKNPIITVTSDGYKDVKGELIPDGTRSFSLKPTILEEIDKTQPKPGNQIGVPSKYINDPIVTKWIDDANKAIADAGGLNEVQKETSPDGKTIYYSAAITKCKDSNKVPNANGTECMDLPNRLTTASSLNPAVIKPGNISVKNPASVTQLKPAQIQQIQNEVKKTPTKPGNQIGVPNGLENIPIVTQWIDNANDAIDAAGGANEVQKETSPDGKTIYYSAAITKCKDSNKVPNANGTECMDLPNQLTTASSLNPAVIKPGNISVKNPASVTQLKPAQIQQIQNKVQKTPTRPGNQISVPNGLENIPTVTQWIDDANDAIDAAGGANEVQKETSPDGKTIYFSSVITECQNGKAPIEDGTKCPSDNTAQESKSKQTEENKGSPFVSSVNPMVASESGQGTQGQHKEQDQKDTDKGKDSNGGFTPIKVNLVDDKTNEPIAIDPESISGLPEKSYIEGNTIYVPTDKIPANGKLPITVKADGYEGGKVDLPTNKGSINVPLTKTPDAKEQGKKTEDPHELNEVRPVGYESEFSEKCNDSGGHVTEIKADDIDYMPNKEDLDFFNMTDEDWRKFYCDCTKSGKVYNKTTKECEEERNDLTGAVTEMITNFKKQVKSLKDKECPPQQQGQ